MNEITDKKRILIFLPAYNVEKKILNVLKELNPKYYSKNQKVIKFEEFENMIKTESDFVLIVCELEGPV